MLLSLAFKILSFLAPFCLSNFFLVLWLLLTNPATENCLWFPDPVSVTLHRFFPLPEMFFPIISYLEISLPPLILDIPLTYVYNADTLSSELSQNNL